MEMLKKNNKELQQIPGKTIKIVRASYAHPNHGNQSVSNVVHYATNNTWSVHSPLSCFRHPVIPVQTFSRHQEHQLLWVAIALCQQVYRLAENK